MHHPVLVVGGHVDTSRGRLGGIHDSPAEGM